MLILMRRAGESIFIGPNIVITLVSLDRNRARIGIQAPRDITVDREEIAKKKLSGIEPPLKRSALNDAMSAADPANESQDPAADSSE